VTAVLEGAVLTLVIEYPGHGHAVGVRFQQRYAGVIRSNKNHVYGTLTRLHRAGLLTASSTPIDARQPSRRLRGKTYYAKSEAVATWREWLQEPLWVRDTVLDMRARMRSVRPDAWDAMIAILDRYEQAVRDEVARRDPLAEAADLADLLDRDFYDTQTESALLWIESARERVMRRADRR
jgi:DNA-binding PadR family transcriptional regulator